MMNMPTQTALRASTKLACEIAGMNPDRLNEAIHAGDYPCAPVTTPGKARSFDVDDIVSLRLYRGFLQAGLNAAAAGHKACMIRRFMADHPDTPRVFIIGTDFGPMDYFRAEFDPLHGFININGAQSLEVKGCEMINLDSYRRFIVFRIAEADKNRVVGD